MVFFFCSLSSKKTPDIAAALVIPAAEKPTETTAAIHNSTTDPVPGLTAVAPDNTSATDPAWFAADNLYDAKQSK